MKRYLSRWKALTSTYPLACLIAVFGYGHPSGWPGLRSVDIPRDSKSYSDRLIGSLVNQLNDPDYTSRERALIQLSTLGSKAKPQLEDAETSKEVERRHRVARLLKVIRDRERRQNDLKFEARLHDFAADTDGKQKFSLPGWDHFRSLVGEDLEARQYFVEMQRRNVRLLAAASDGDPEKVAELLEATCVALETAEVQALWSPHSATIGTLLFVATDQRFTLPKAMLVRIGKLARQNQAPLQEPGKKLLALWLAQPTPGKMPEVVELKLKLVAQYGVAESLPWLLTVATNRQMPVRLRMQGLLSLSVLGNIDHLETVETLLDDTTVCNEVPNFHLQDLALAVLVQMSGQPWSNYGLPPDTDQRMWWATHQDLDALKLENADARDQGIATWKSWSKTNREFRERLKAFSAAEPGAAQLPSWDAFRQLAGNTPEARNLFVKMQTAERQLLEKYEKDPADVQGEIHRFFVSRRQGRRLASWLPSAAALLLVGGDQTVELPHSLKTLIQSVAQEIETGKELESSPYRAPFTKLLQRWKQRDQAFETRLIAFERGLKRRQRTVLPGWKRYRTLVENTPENRLFFADMQRAAAKLLAGYKQGPDQAVKEFERCLADMKQESPPFYRETLAALLLVASDERIKLGKPAILEMCQLALAQTNYDDGRGLTSSAFRHLLACWLERPTDPKMPEVDEQNVQLIVRFFFPDKVGVLQRIAANTKVNVESRAKALLAIGMYGSPDNTEPLISLLQEKGRPFDGNRGQLRDIALAVMVYLRSQPLPDYGFPNDYDPNAFFDNLKGHPDLEKVGQRQAALVRWQTWLKEERQFRRKLEAFAGDLDGSNHTAVPGWEEYRKIAGNTPATRTSFVKLVRAEPDVLKAYAQNDTELVRVFEVRQKLHSKRRSAGIETSFPTIEAIVLTSICENVRIADSYYIIHQEQGYREKDPIDSLRKLLSYWFNQRAKLVPPAPLDRMYMLLLVRQYQMKLTALTLASETLKNPPTDGDPWKWLETLLALSIVGALGDSTHCALVEPLLNNRTLVPDMGNSSKNQICDAALVTLIHIRQQQPRDYGIAQGFDPNKTGEQYYLASDGDYFRSDKRRTRAIAKWKAWAKRHPTTDTQVAP